MNEWLRFEAEPAMVLVSGVLAVGAWLGLAYYWERGRKLRRWRLFAWGLAVVCLWALVARPSTRRGAAARPAVLLTQGATSGEVAAEPGVGPSEMRFALPGARDASGEVQVVPDAAWLARTHPEINTLEIRGAGLDPWDLAALPFSVDFSPPAMTRTPGVTDVRWPREPVLGEPLVVRGRLAGVSSPGRLALIGSAGEEAAVLFSELDDGRFELRAKPKLTGPQVYRIVGRREDGEVLFANELGVKVFESPKRRVLWLQESPSFEARAVKSWLADAEAQVVVRTRISRDRFRTEFVNLRNRRLGRFDRQVFAGFDLVVLGNRALARLGPRIRRELTAAIEDDGLGALLIASGSGTGKSLPPFDAFEVVPVAEVEALSVEPRWPGEAAGAPLEISARELKPGSVGRPLVLDAAGRRLAAVAPRARGRVATTLLDDSYRWRLTGETETFSSVWRRLVEQTARDTSAGRWELAAGPLLVDRPTVIGWVGAGPETLSPAELDDGHDVVSLAAHQDAVESDRWSFRLWPRRAGWHRMKFAGSEVEFHVADRDDWQAWSEENRTVATRRAALEGLPNRAEAGPERWQRWRRWPPFSLLVLALAGLWLDERRGPRGPFSVDFARPGRT